VRCTLTLEQVGLGIARWGLMLCLLFLGLAKFTPEEAQGIQPLIAHCHLMAWMYSVWSLQGDVIGTVELCFGRAAGALYLVDAGLTSRGSELRNT